MLPAWVCAHLEYDSDLCIEFAVACCGAAVKFECLVFESESECAAGGDIFDECDVKEDKFV